MTYNVLSGTLSLYTTTTTTTTTTTGSIDYRRILPMRSGKYFPNNGKVIALHFRRLT